MAGLLMKEMIARGDLQRSESPQQLSEWKGLLAQNVPIARQIHGCSKAASCSCRATRATSIDTSSAGRGR